MIRENPPLGAPMWIDLMAADTAGAVAFYTSLFGWTAEEPNDEFGGYQTFFLDGERVAGLMTRGDDGAPMDVWSVYLHVADAAATVAAAADHGGTVMVDATPVGDLGTMGVLVDPGAAVIGMWQPGTHRGGVVGAPGAPCHFELHTRDFDTAVSFYRDVFGMTFGAIDDGFRYALYDLGAGFGAGIMDATDWLPDGAPSAWSVYFAADVDPTVAKAVELGGSVVQPAEDTPYGRLVTLAAPDGAIFKLRGETAT